MSNQLPIEVTFEEQFPQVSDQVPIVSNQVAQVSNQVAQVIITIFSIYFNITNFLKVSNQVARPDIQSEQTSNQNSFEGSG